MKKLVWSETLIQGGRRFQGALARPAGLSGPFQDIPVKKSGILGNDHLKIPSVYKDIGVFAYRVPGRGQMAVPRQVRVDGKEIAVAPLIDGLYAKGVDLELASLSKTPTIDIDYSSPQTVRSLTVFIRDIAGMFGDAKYIPVLSYSDDKKTWSRIVDLHLTSVPTTVSFDPVTAQYFRVTLVPNGKKDFAAFTPSPGVNPGVVMAMVSPPKVLELGELRLSAEAKIDNFETKAGFVVVSDYFELEGRQSAKADAVPADSMIDLTSKMKADGSLDWTPPAGDWKVLRLGWSLTGRTNHPATAEATGLEVDKYDARAVRDYLETYLTMYKDAAGEELVGKRGVGAILTDSVEMGASNWTPGLWEKFEDLRGYDPKPFLPALVGDIVGSREASDQFLYDFRRTLSELLATEHYKTVADVAHENDMKVYGEALESLRVVLGDDMDMRRYADYPMSALWTHSRERGPMPSYLLDMKGASSVANVYGQNIAAAESMTSALQPWAHAPADLRRIIDLEFAHGINRPVIHTSVHQPLDDKQPGLSLLIFGQFFNRHETWAEMARPWVDYMARNSFMLQQGRQVSDVAYFYGEEKPIISQKFEETLADLPKHYDYDFVSANTVLEALDVVDGELRSTGGARYEVLFLGSAADRMTLPVLKRIEVLAKAGATIVGKPPVSTPSLGDERTAFYELVQRLWGGGAQTEVGQGRVIKSRDVEQSLAELGIAPDYQLVKASADSEVLFLHRTLPDGDLYFVNNRKDRAESLVARFRVTGKAPEIWRADTGAIAPASYRMEGEHTLVSLDMAADESFFVVFREPTKETTRFVEKPTLSPVYELTGSWEVAFQAGRGAPERITLDSLISLSEHDQTGVKYFSGVSSYTKTFSLPEGIEPGQRLVLDLGEVADIAEITLNGKKLGTVWHAPWQMDIGVAMVAGENTLRVDVANLWVNRLIGDAQPGVNKITFTTFPTYVESAPLRSSGLLGPVRLMKAQ